MKNAAIAWLIQGGLLFVSFVAGTVVTLSFIVLGVVSMELADSFIIEPAIRSYGPEAVFLIMMIVVVTALGIGYFILARHLWMKFPDRPAGVGPLRWLLTIYGRSWWLGLSSIMVRKLYLLLVAVLFFGLGIEWLIAKSPEEAIYIVTVGLLTPIISTVTFYHPFIGSTQLQRAAKKT